MYSPSSPARAVGQVLLPFVYGDSGHQCKELRMNTETAHIGENSEYREFESEYMQIDQNSTLTSYVNM
jgi:hypothetical protein